MLPRCPARPKKKNPILRCLLLGPPTLFTASATHRASCVFDTFPISVHRQFQSDWTNTCSEWLGTAWSVLLLTQFWVFAHISILFCLPCLCLMKKVGVEISKNLNESFSDDHGPYYLLHKRLCSLDSNRPCWRSWRRSNRETHFPFLPPSCSWPRCPGQAISKWLFFLSFFSLCLP